MALSDPPPSSLIPPSSQLRVTHKVNTALKGVSEDLKMFGVQNVNDEDTDWAALHSQDLSKMPRYIIMPNGTFRVSWDMYVGMLLIYIAGEIAHEGAKKTKVTVIPYVTSHY